VGSEKLYNAVAGNGAAENCTICGDLLANLELFYNVLENARRAQASDWLTFEDIPKELKISKSILYRLIRDGELEAVNIVHADGKVPKKGRYRITRENLNRYLKSKTVKPFSGRLPTSRSRYFPKDKRTSAGSSS
jgi:excisionase family DNA binding protein